MNYETAIDPVYFVVIEESDYYNMYARYDILHVVPGEVKDFKVVYEKYCLPYQTIDSTRRIRMLVFARHEGEETFMANQALQLAKRREVKTESANEQKGP